MDIRTPRVGLSVQFHLEEGAPPMAATITKVRGGVLGEVDLVAHPGAGESHPTVAQLSAVPYKYRQGEVPIWPSYTFPE